MNFSTTFSRQHTWYLVYLCSQTRGVSCHGCCHSWVHKVDVLPLAAVLCLSPSCGKSSLLSPLLGLLWQRAPGPDTGGFLGTDCWAARASQSLLLLLLPPQLSLRSSSRARDNVHAQRSTAPRSCSSHTDSFLSRTSQRGV